jgi:hypothetical protein
LFFLPARLRVHRAPGIPHALWAEDSCTTRAKSRRGNAVVCLNVIASAAKQSSFLHGRKLDCFVAEPVIGRAFARPGGFSQ